MKSGKSPKVRKMKIFSKSKILKRELFFSNFEFLKNTLFSPNNIQGIYFVVRNRNFCEK